jgi:hypothetical protein
MCTYKKVTYVLALTIGRKDSQAAVRQIFNLLSKKNFASGADALTSLGRTLVGTGLKTDHRLASTQLFVRKVALALF